ncbi:hypothetical protein ACJDU8_24065 [Clostridium sp. WILCCON 0269]|uniref:Uncharacterized protein n=1 Tax=Candidatus Clostridium eludens TaxID=3381663 RepID=A0ABW8SR98_9CLOT
MLKNKYKLISAVMIAAPLLINTGIATTVHANPRYANPAPVSYNSYYYTFANFQTKLDSLVSAGTITQAQESIILNLYYSDKIGSYSTFKAQLDVLVTVGTITQSQEYSILNVFTSWGSSWELPAPSDQFGQGNGAPNGSGQHGF